MGVAPVKTDRLYESCGLLVPDGSIGCLLDRQVGISICPTTFPRPNAAGFFGVRTFDKSVPVAGLI